CATAKTRLSLSFNATSIARSVPGRPAVIGKLTPGSRTAFLIGTTGRVSVSLILFLSSGSALSCASPRQTCPTHNTGLYPVRAHGRPAAGGREAGITLAVERVS